MSTDDMTPREAADEMSRDHADVAPPPEGTTEPRGACAECGGELDMHYLSCSIWPHNADRPSVPVPAAEDEAVRDQPPGVDPDDYRAMPSAPEAASRVLEYVGWFGDGLIDGDPDGFPLYARDLEAVARAALDAAGVPALQAEVERLRADYRAACEGRADARDERDEARRQVADLRAGIEREIRHMLAVPDDVRREREGIANDLRALLAGSGEQPGACGHDFNALVDVDDEGHAVCSECEPSLSGHPAPVVPDPRDEALRRDFGPEAFPVVPDSTDPEDLQHTPEAAAFGAAIEQAAHDSGVGWDEVHPIELACRLMVAGYRLAVVGQDVTHLADCGHDDPSGYVGPCEPCRAALGTDEQGGQQG